MTQATAVTEYSNDNDDGSNDNDDTDNNGSNI